MKTFKPQEIVLALQAALDIDQRVSGLDYLKKIVKNIAGTFECKYVLVGHAVKPDNERILTDVVWAGTDYFENFTYNLAGTPCTNVLSGNRACVYPKNAAELFPEDKLLAEMNCEAYAGAPMITKEGKLTGIVVMLDDSPIEDDTFYDAVIEFLAMRIGAELDRYYIEENLKRQVLERTSELEKTNKELETALSEIKSLQGIIPICSSCKKIRDDQGFWQQVDSYITQHSEATFSHAICPECTEEYYRQLKALNK